MDIGDIIFHQGNEHMDSYCNDLFLFYTQPHFHTTLVTQSHEPMFVAPAAVASAHSV